MKRRPGLWMASALVALVLAGCGSNPPATPSASVADRLQDTMGFTVVGPDHFLGSGHPDVRDTQLYDPNRRPLLGLIESRDAGRSWRPLSLLGEADFHDLQVAHGRVYGYDATGQPNLLVLDWTGPDGLWGSSPDGQVWRSADAPGAGSGPGGWAANLRRCWSRTSGWEEGPDAGRWRRWAPTPTSWSEVRG